MERNTTSLLYLAMNVVTIIWGLAVWYSRSNNPYSATVPVEADDMHGFTVNLLLLREPAHAPAA